MKGFGFSAALVVAVLATPSFAALEAENVLTAVPEGFVVGFEEGDDSRHLVEFIPDGETVDDWSAMVTVVTLHDADNADAAATNMADAWIEACKDGSAGPLSEDVVNGYPYVIWGYDCPLNAQTGKPETMIMKVIPGRDALYMVQYAVRAPYSDEFGQTAYTYLVDQVSVCDTRIAEQACPEGM